MFGPETFIVRIAEDAMAPRVRVGDYVWIDPESAIARGVRSVNWPNQTVAAVARGRAAGRK